MKLVADSKIIKKRMIDMDIKNVAELSRLSGVSRPKIHEYLKGISPLATTFSRLCNFLELSPDDAISLVNTSESRGVNN